MIENLIFYSICLFFALIGLGASWSARHKYQLTFKAIFVITPIIIFILYLTNPELLKAFDIRVIFKYLDYSEDALPGRIRMFFVTILWFSIIGYLIITLILLTNTIQRITRRSSGPTNKQVGP